MSSHWQDIARGARVNFLGVLARSFRGAYLIFAARAFGGEVLGLFLLSWNAVDVLSKIGLLGLDRGLLRFLPRKNEASAGERDALALSAVALSLVLGAAASVALYLAARPLAVYALEQPGAAEPLKILAPGILCISVMSVLLAITRVERRMEYEVWTRSFVEPGALLALALLFWALGWGGRSLYVAQLLALVMATVVAVLFVHRLRLMEGVSARDLVEGERRWWREGVLRRLLAFSTPIGLYDLVSMAVLYTDFFLLARYVSPHDLGVYGAALQIAIIVRKSRLSFEPALVPVLSQEIRAGREAAVHDSLTKASRWIFALDAGFLLGMAVFGGDLMRLFYGGDFARGGLALFLVSLGYAVNGFFGITENVIMLQRPYWNLWTWLAGLPIAVTLNVLLIPVWGLAGAGASVVITMVILVSIRIWQTYVLVGWQPFHRDIGGLAAIAMALGVATYAVKMMGPSAGVPGHLYRTAIGLAMIGTYAWMARRTLDGAQQS